MKKLNLLIAVACAGFMLQACHNSAATTTTDTTATADITKTDTSKVTTNTPDTIDASFATKAAAGGLTEVVLSNLALQKSTNSKIKDFANMMVNDHTRANEDLAVIAKTKNIVLPIAPDAHQKSDIDELSKKTGSDFDKAYVNQMVADHRKTVDMFIEAQKAVKDSTLNAFITVTLPTLQKHLYTINTIKSGM